MKRTHEWIAEADEAIRSYDIAQKQRRKRTDFGVRNVSVQENVELFTPDNRILRQAICINGNGHTLWEEMPYGSIWIWREQELEERP